MLLEYSWVWKNIVDSRVDIYVYKNIHTTVHIL